MTGQLNDAAKPSKTSLASTTAAKDYQRIRNHAITLYAILKQDLHLDKACACPVPHSVNLQLEVRSTTLRKPGLRFGVVLSLDRTAASPTANVPWDWRPVELEPVESIQGEMYEEKDEDLAAVASNNSHNTNLLAVTNPLQDSGRSRSSMRKYLKTPSILRSR